MTDDLANSLTVVVDRLVALTKEDAQLRSHLRQLAEAILQATDISKQETSEPTLEETQEANVEAATNPVPVRGGPNVEFVASSADERLVEETERLPELTFGRTSFSVEDAAPSLQKYSSDFVEADLSLIEARCRLKAEGARWAANRQRRIEQGTTFATEIAPADRAIIARAKELPDCLLWMCRPHAPSPSEFGLYEDVAGCFECVANIVGLLRKVQDEPGSLQGEFGKLLNLLAEAQSALRASIATIHGPIDNDQIQVFNWLKDTAAEKRILIERYMKLDDPADPAQWDKLYVRIAAIDSVIQDAMKRERYRRKLLGKVQHKLSLIVNEPDAASEHWRILASTVDELVNDDLPPSNRELRELLVPVIDSLPDPAEFPQGFRLVVREIDRFIATSPPPAVQTVTPPTPEVEQVANLLKGRSMVLIGGDRRQASWQALKDAFHLKDLIWIETREHESIDSFEPSVARPAVAVVVLAIRWSSHSFGEVREFCERHGKPLVRLPGGYNPNQVAMQIMSQCSGRLPPQ